MIRAGLAGNRRPGGRWLLAWLLAADDPRGMTDQWARAIEAEQDVLRNAPSQSSPEVVTILLECQIPWLKKLGLADEAAAATRTLIQGEKGDPETLLSLLQWLIEQKDWKAVHECWPGVSARRSRHNRRCFMPWPRPRRPRAMQAGRNKRPARP